MGRKCRDCGVRQYDRRHNSPNHRHSIDEREGDGSGSTQCPNSPYGDKYRHSEDQDSNSMSRSTGRPRVSGYTMTAYSAELNCFTRKTTPPWEDTAVERKREKANERETEKETKVKEEKRIPGSALYEKEKDRLVQRMRRLNKDRGKVGLKGRFVLKLRGGEMWLEMV